MMINTPLNASLLRGVAELEPTDRGLRLHRLPAWARAQSPDPQLAAVEVQPSGVRLAVRTRATVVEIDALRTTTVLPGGPVRPPGTYDLVVDGTVVDQQPSTGGDVMTIDLTTGGATTQEGPIGTVRFDGLPDRAKRLEIWLPWNEETRLVALRTDAPVEPLTVGERRSWVHHGSSISHGSDAASPTGTWPGQAALRGDVELTNLGLGGSALLDPCVARVIRDFAADLISLKIGINLVNTDLMRLRALGPAMHGFLDTIREGHPDTPLLVVSPLWCGMHEQTPGPTALDEEALASGTLRFLATGDPEDVATGKLTLSVIRHELARVVEQRAPADAQLFYLDGLALYGEADAVTLPLPDALHPDAETHRLIGERFAAHAFGPAGPFAAARV